MKSNKSNTRRMAAFLCAAAVLAAAAGVARANDGASRRHDGVIRVLTEQFRVPTGNAARIVSAVEQAADKLKLPASLILAVIATESSFDPHATSPVGAAGLMQVMPGTRHDFESPELAHADIYEPVRNIFVGTSILRRYLDQAGGDLEKALHRYSGGTRGYAQRVQAHWRLFSDFDDAGAPAGAFAIASSAR